MSTVQESLVLGPELAGTLMTPEEFDAVEEADENYKYELINGVLVVAPPPAEGERGPNQLLGHLLLNYAEQHPEVHAYTLPEHTIKTLTNRRRADRVIWASLGHTPSVRRDQPTIAVEFVSVGRSDRERDYVAKRQEYAEIGIAEYWVIDRIRRTMTVIRNAPDGTSEIEIAEADNYQTPLLPGVELPLTRLLAEADMLDSMIDEEST